METPKKTTSHNRLPARTRTYRSPASGNSTSHARGTESAHTTTSSPRTTNSTHATSHAPTHHSHTKSRSVGAGRKRTGGPIRHREQTKRVNYAKPSQQSLNKKSLSELVPPLAEDAIRIIPLGGTEEIGRNMTAIEYAGDILVVDAGFQFQEEETPGIDYILPNTEYLELHKDRIKGVLITHGHLDHIGGIPYIMDRIGNPTIYTRNLTAIMIKKRQAEFPHLPDLSIEVVEKNSIITLGKLRVKFFAVTHTIPDSMGIIIETPYGSIVTPGDYKLTHTDGVPHDSEVEEYKQFEKENVLCLLADSTNVDNPGFSTPEHEVHKNFDTIIKDTKSGRLIIGTFASQLERLIAIMRIAEKYKKKIVLEGRSMKTNIEIAKLADIFTPQPDTIIPAQDIDNYPPHKIIVLATGAQGEEFAALMRIATNSHKYIRLKKEDTILLSSSIIPGNEKSVQKLKDNLARQKANIVHYRTTELYIHSSGHGNREELKWLHQQIRPKFFVPIHGSHYMLRQHARLAGTLGMKEENIVVPENNLVIDITEKGSKITPLKEHAGSGMVFVDGFSVGGVQDVVIRDRQMLAKDGMFVIIATINSKTGKLRKSPDIISRGFVYLRESQDLLHQARIITKKTIEEATEGMNPINFDFLKGIVTDQVAKFLFQKTNKHPIVIPVLLGV